MAESVNWHTATNFCLNHSGDSPTGRSNTERRKTERRMTERRMTERRNTERRNTESRNIEFRNTCRRKILNVLEPLKDKKIII